MNMQPSHPNITTKRTPVQRRPPQMSLGFMMLMMIIFALISAGILYAAKVPAVQQEINVLWRGNAGQTGDDVGRLAHITFIMFTFTSPLLLAGALSTALAIHRWYDRRRHG